MTSIVSGSAGITFPDGSVQATAASGGAEWQSVQTTGFTAVSGEAYACNTTSAAFTVTLPAVPAVGEYIQLVDYARTWGTNALTVNPNGLKINGSTSNAVLGISGQAVAIVYIDSTQGWICYSQGASIGAYTASYLVIAGGGAGGGPAVQANAGGGGGGAGGYLTASATFSSGVAYTVTIGAGGAINTSGANSSISSVVTATGGGAGAPGFGQPGISGGSGGGGAANNSAGGAGTAGQGFAGGNGATPATGYPTGGGGGAASAGGNATGDTVAGNGGAGSSSSITGSAVTRAGGGGGSAYNGQGTAGTGGAGGGGNGSNGSSAATAAPANSGSGGGAGSSNASGGVYPPGTGGSGIVIISYVGAQRGTGGTITSSGGNTIHTFTTSGTYTA
jgi:hypothetical protein